MNVIANAEEVLEDGEEVRLGRRVFDGVLDELEALVDVVQLEPDVVEPLSELVEVGLAVLVEDLQLRLEVLRRVLLESLFFVQRENIRSLEVQKTQKLNIISLTFTPIEFPN